MFTFKEDEMYLLDNDGQKIAFISYPLFKDNVRNIRKVFVDESLRGQGIAGKAMLALYDHFKKEGIKTIATCPYAVAWFEKNKDKTDILVKSDEPVACAL
ncbi:GNAT family N-acetyltransferase [Acholeplasma hippikon]|uniref:Acetyltransferase (GNAT) family n=1 Tax=Acholeplasma hippikon TaxID=264636 RepID=A0A449BJ26_9MOLU|nr:GNAT family N-acetyltransferase [Acholeplasma hippikon]VEU82403.1 Acetyltransferase (GNAT) family [Acholeplasma hippikon]